MSAETVNALNFTAIVLAVIGAVVCIRTARKCNNKKSVLHYFGAFNLLFFAGVYILAWLGDWYVVKSGILTRLGVIALVGLISSRAYFDSQDCQ
jgi:hypothetical protein